MSYLATKAAQKLVTDVRDIKLEILKEETKGYDSDDAKLEMLYQKAQILIEAAQAEFNLHAAKS
jgi:hypothetical protein